MADKQTLARPYAKAAFEMARETNTLEQWSKAFGAMRAIAADAGVLAVIARPTVGEAEQLDLLSALAGQLGDAYVFGGNEASGRNFLRLLVENGRVDVLPEIAERFDALKAATEQTVDATVTAASELSEDTLARIRDALAERLGQRVTLTAAVDPDLIGGAVISAGDFVIDGSVKSRLARLANTLTQ